jgi:hypothetical protein
MRVGRELHDASRKGEQTEQTTFRAPVKHGHQCTVLSMCMPVNLPCETVCGSVVVRSWVRWPVYGG